MAQRQPHHVFLNENKGVEDCDDEDYDDEDYDDDHTSLPPIWGHANGGEHRDGHGEDDNDEALYQFSKSMNVHEHRGGKDSIIDVHDNTTAIFETYFNDILVPGPSPSEARCANKSSRDRRDPDISLKAPDAPGYTDILRFALQIFHDCRAKMARDCNNLRCIHFKERLESVMPQCATWPGLRRWALQVAACTCYNYEHVGCIDILSTWDWEIDSKPGLAEMSYGGKSSAFTDWARQLNIRDILDIFSWLRGITSGKYEHFPLPSLLADTDNDRAINQANSRIYEGRLCPHRMLAISVNLPGGESNIPALIPDQHHPCTYQHDFCSTGLSHQNCTFDYCEISAINFTNVVQLHRPNCAGKCKKKSFPLHLLDKVAKQDRPTAWAIDGKLRPLESGERYMAISHVWSDGTGGSGSVNQCLYDFFCDVAHSLNCKGLWWDAICIPQDTLARAKAIERMHEYYSQAACTVVHDLCLAMSEWIDGSDASFALVMSNWFTRGWTALELARSKQVEVLFRAREFPGPGYVLKDLDEAILSRRGTVSSLSHILASTAIRSLRGVARGFRCLTVNDVLTSLGPRHTSWTRDRAIITGLFVGLENMADNQHGIYRQVISRIGRISSDQLFHNATPSAGPFTWFPSNLFDLPISSYEEPDIDVLNDGSISGVWSVFPNLPSVADNHFFWDMLHLMSKHRVRGALSDRRHVILLETQTDTITRGLVVKVMEYVESRSHKSLPILCHYVGPVYFRVPQRKNSDLSYSVIIGDGGVDGVDLDIGVSALDYINQYHQPRTTHDKSDESVSKV